MPTDIKGNQKVWTTLESRTKLITLFAKPEDSIFPRTSSSTARERLHVEDLDVLSREHGTPIKKLNRTSLNLERPQCSGRIDNEISSGNFTVYQGGDLNKFFGCDVFTPKRVSEVCLVNDHYILVKIPESQSVQPEMSCRQSPNHTAAEISKESQTGKKLKKYLHCGNGRSRRVSPTPEPVNTATTSSTSWSSNGCVQEVFKTRTIIKGNLNVFQQFSSSRGPKHDLCQPADTKKATEFVNYSYKRQETQAYRKPLQTSVSDQVELESHGRLETPGAMQGTTRKNTRKHSLPRPRRPFGLSFRWFLRSFRNRHASKKSTTTKKKKINAVVYKTFFVSWTKAKHSSHSKCLCCMEKSLRRTRSAVF